MTSLPFPTFATLAPVGDLEQKRAALPAVGRCRFDPEVLSAAYREIVAKNVEQAQVDPDSAAGDDQKDEQKKLKKKFMKQGVAMAQKFLRGALKLDVSIIDVEVMVDSRDLISTDGCLAACLLDAGCQTVVTDGLNLEAMDAAKIPRERLAAHFVYDKMKGKDENGGVTANLAEAFEAAAGLASIVSVEIKEAADATLDDMLAIYSASSGLENLECVIQISPAMEETDLEELTKEIGKRVPEGKISLTDPTARQLGLAYAARVRTDRDDGLFTTVVNTRNGEALGLVYSSKDSIVAALECGRGVYWSRKRGLWRKGDTSGRFQTLHRLDVDCDGDALRFTVTQQGKDVAAFCHLGTLTCWSKPRGILHLQETLQDRFKSAPEGSYTKRLFDDPNLLREKLVEEAQELSEATEKEDVAGELADLLYFAMVRAVAAGVTFDDAVAELDRRSRKVTRRKGDSKAYRTEAANAILHKNCC